MLKTAANFFQVMYFPSTSRKTFFFPFKEIVTEYTYKQYDYNMSQIIGPWHTETVFSTGREKSIEK